MKATNTLGLRPATHTELFGDAGEVLLDAELLAKQGRLSELEVLYNRAWESKERLPGGVRLYSEILVWAVAHEPTNPADLPAYLQPFATGFADNPTPFAAALYSAALQQAGGVARGTAFAHKTSVAQFAAYGDYNAQSLDVLYQVSDISEDDYPWREARYSVLSSQPHLHDERQSLFDEVVSCDPGNIGVFYSAMISALPRWAGRDEQDAELVARRAMDLNWDEWGAGGYALAYSFLVNVGSLRATDTAVDVALAEQGFRDLMARTPSVMLLNKFARTMSWVGAESVVKEIFASGLHQIDRYTWGGNDDADAVDTAARAYVWAKHNS